MFNCFGKEPAQEDAAPNPYKNRPPDDAFRQQRLQAWQPIMTPLKVIIIFVAIGIAFIPSGIRLIDESNEIYMDTIEYDGPDQSLDCSISEPNVMRKCTAHFNITEDVDGPIFVYYQLTNFFQNHRAYVSSRCPLQLEGEELKACTLCTSMDKAGNKTLNPCGLIANSYFTDIFTLNVNSSSPSDLYLDESGIAWTSDQDKFKQPSGFKAVELNSTQIPNDPYSCLQTGMAENCQTYVDPATGATYNYIYPEPDEYQYLYESYKIDGTYLISPLLGVEDEHFKVWMRPAALPKFRKLYGKIEGNFQAGDVLTFQILANFEVNSFDGTKSLVISTTGEFGGRNPFLGLSYIVVGSISLLFALLFITKQLIAPRAVADPASLNWSL